MDDLYREDVLDHYEHPHHRGSLVDADISIADTNPSCGDRISIDVRLSPDRTRIAEVAFSGDGCVISQAATSMLMDAVVGTSVDEVQQLDRQAVLDMLGISLTPTRIRCAVLGLKVLQAGIARYLAGHSGVQTPTAPIKGHAHPQQ
jgi:nitrogen fixation protein NifU and related proteins